MVCMSVMYLRKRNPELVRPFRVPWYPLTPILGVISCALFMIVPILLDIMSKAFNYDILGAIVGNPGDVTSDPVALWLLVGYALLGVLVYTFYSSKHSKLRNPGK
jgi:APA family basic amino acid/polyamine antiporter